MMYPAEGEQWHYSALFSIVLLSKSNALETHLQVKAEADLTQHNYSVSRDCRTLHAV